MNYVRLGNTGLEVSGFGLGCMSYGKSSGGLHSWPWSFTEEASRPFIQRAVEMGVNFFDTANNYSDGESEAVLGRAIRFATMIGVNLHGFFHLSRRAASHMLRAGSGHIVNITATIAERPVASLPAALAALTRVASTRSRAH
jgi:diketogulonate reductase-like aldo/keto reductase